MQTTKATMNRKCLIKGNRENQYISADTHTHTQTGRVFLLGVAGKTFVYVYAMWYSPRAAKERKRR